jgi:trimeric autotransporter adhesin
MHPHMLRPAALRRGPAGPGVRHSIAAALAVATAGAAGAQCEFGWEPGNVLLPNYRGVSRAAVASGVAGDVLFLHGPGAAFSRWDGTSIAALPAVPSGVTAVGWFEVDGQLVPIISGAFDTFARRLAYFDGVSWREFAGGLSDRATELLTRRENGHLVLYAAGPILEAGGTPVSHIARWDGAAWDDLAGGTTATIESLASGIAADPPLIYAGGALGSSAWLGIWDGQTWTETTRPGTSSSLIHLTAAPEEGQEALFACERSTVDGISQQRLWRILANEWRDITPAPVTIKGMTSWDTGGGPRPVIAGSFSLEEKLCGTHLAVWDGVAWRSTGNDLCSGFAEFAVPFEDSLIVGGHMRSAGDALLNGVGRWRPDGTVTPLIQRSGSNENVWCFAEHDDGAGTALYAGGEFTAIGGARAFRVAKFRDQVWSPVGGGIGSEYSPWEIVYALASHNDGNGPALFAGGSFHRGPVARWDGSTWTDAGTPWREDAPCYALASFDDGTGPALYLGGSGLGPARSESVLRLRAGSWERVGVIKGDVYSLAVFDDGSGPALYAGGRNLSGDQNTGLARWDGESWQFVAAFTRSDSFVLKLQPLLDSTIPTLAVGGNFLRIGGIEAQSVATWNGSEWQAFPPGATSTGYSIGRFNFGSGPELVVTGSGSGPCVRVLGPTGWREISTGGQVPIRGVFALHESTGPQGRSLWVGGGFSSIGDVLADNIARLVLTSTLPADTNADSAVDLLDLATLLAHFPTTDGATRADGDVDGDGDVDLADLAALLSEFGRHCR